MTPWRTPPESFEEVSVEIAAATLFQLSGELSALSWSKASWAAASSGAWTTRMSRLAGVTNCSGFAS